MTHPAHGVVLEIGGVTRSVRATFALSLAIEERYGSLLDTAQRVISGQTMVTDLADLLEIMVPQASRGEIEAHFDEVGISGVIAEVSSVFAQMMRGWSTLNEEVEAAAPLATRRGAGRPRGAKNRPKPGSSPGETSSAEPQSSVSVHPSSGELPLTSSGVSGELPGAQPEEPRAPLLNGSGHLSTTPTQCADYSAHCPDTE